MDCELNQEQSFKVPSLIGKQSNNLCWKLRDLQETICFGEDLIKKMPQIKLLLLEGELGAGKTSLVKGIAKGLRINEPITSPTFALSHHYTSRKTTLIHLDLYRLEQPELANELFLQEEEEINALGGVMVVEWPQRLSLNLFEGWKAKLKYLKTSGRHIQIYPPISFKKSST